MPFLRKKGGGGGEDGEEGGGGKGKGEVGVWDVGELFVLIIVQKGLG